MIVGITVLYGLLFGSFMNAVVYRVPRRESLNTRSHCPRCNRTITAWQNVPVVSYLALRGRCAGCNERISLRYPTFEALMALIFGLIAWHFGPSSVSAAGLSHLIALLVFAFVALTLTLIDIEHLILPTRIIYPALLVIALAFTAEALTIHRNLSLISFIPLLRGLACAAILFAFYFTLWALRPDAMGFGDVRLAVLVGLVMGQQSWASFATGAFAAFVIGSLAGIVLLAFRRTRVKTQLPFGPSMLAGAWIGLIFGSTLIDMYASIGGLG